MSSAAAPLPNAADEAQLLYEQYGDRIFAFCLSRLGKREEAEDAVQTTFLYVLRGLRRGVEPRFPLAWLFKIAENVCHSRHRVDARRTRHEASRDPELVATLAAPGRDADELMGLPEALRAMPERQRQALLLREWQGLSYQEIGAELGLSQSAVETLLFRARRSLASRLRALDLSAALTFLRSLLKGSAGKVAAGAAVATLGTAAVVLPVVDPGSSAPPGPARAGTTAYEASTSATPAVDKADPSRSALAPAAHSGRPGGERPTGWSSRTRAGSPTPATTPVTPGAAPESPPRTPPGATPAPTASTGTPTVGTAPSVPSTNVGGGATTPVAKAGATVSTDDDSATASAGVAADTPAGPVEASAGAGASTSGATGSVDASAGSQSVGTSATVPVPPPPPAPKLP